MTKLDDILLAIGLRALKLLPPEAAREFGLWLLGPYFAVRDVVTFPYRALRLCVGFLIIALIRGVLCGVDAFDGWRVGTMYRIEAQRFGALEQKEEDAKR